MRSMHSRTALAFGAVLIGASVTMVAPYIPDHWGWFMAMTVFGMAGGFIMSLAIGTVVAAMCLGAPFGELLIMAGKPELSASPVAWAIFIAFAAIGVTLVHLSNLGNKPIAHRPVKE